MTMMRRREGSMPVEEYAAETQGREEELDGKEEESDQLAADEDFFRDGESSFLRSSSSVSDPLPGGETRGDGGSSGDRTLANVPHLPEAIALSEKRHGQRRRRRFGASGAGSRTPLLSSSRVSVDFPLRAEYEDPPAPGNSDTIKEKKRDLPIWRLIPAIRGSQQSRLGFTTSFPIPLSSYPSYGASSLTAVVSSQVGTRGRVGHAVSTADLRYHHRQQERQSRRHYRHRFTLFRNPMDAALDENAGSDCKTVTMAKTWTTGVTLAEKPSFHVGVVKTTTSMISTRQKDTGGLAESWTLRVSIPGPTNWDSLSSLASSSHGSAGIWMMTWLRENMSIATSWSRDFGSVWPVRSSLRLALHKGKSTVTQVQSLSSVGHSAIKQVSSPSALSSNGDLALGPIVTGMLPAISSVSVSLESRSGNTTTTATRIRTNMNRWSASVAWNPHAELPAATGDGSVWKGWMWPRIALSISSAVIPKLVFGIVRPKSSSSSSDHGGDRTCHLSGWYNLREASWSCTASLSKKLRAAGRTRGTDDLDDRNHQFMLGWTRASRWSWTFLVSWRVGKLITVRVPVAISPVMDPFWYPLQVLIGTLAAGLVNNVACGLFLGTGQATLEMDTDATAANGASGSSSTATTRASKLKAQRIADNQQLLMRRTAENRMRAESDKQGLVVNRAVYFTDRESLDVTVPVQFWVQDSVLDIGPATKKDLLGFYDLSYRVAIAEKEPDATPPTEGGFSSWISGLWRSSALSQTGTSSPLDSSMGGRSIRFRSVKPQLKIEYSYNGRTYDVLYHDHDEIVLPRDQDVVRN